MCAGPSWPGKSNLWPSCHYKRVVWCLGRLRSPEAGQLRILLLGEQTKAGIGGKRTQRERKGIGFPEIGTNTNFGAEVGAGLNNSHSHQRLSSHFKAGGLLMGWEFTSALWGGTCRWGAECRGTDTKVENTETEIEMFSVLISVLHFIQRWRLQLDYQVRICREIILIYSSSSYFQTATFLATVLETSWRATCSDDRKEKFI